MTTNYNGEKAVIYARYSSHSQTEQSIEGQLHDAYDFAKKNNITVISEYIDRAQSGTTDSRNAFQRMIKDSVNRQFSIILVWKIDRFARNREDAAIYRSKLRKNGVRVISVMESISEGAEGILIESVLEGMAEYYSRNLSENIKRGIRESIAKGWFPGGIVPYGFIHQDHKLVPDPRIVPIVKEIFERYADGEKPATITKDLNERGVLFKNGGIFKKTTIAHILDDRAYIGELVRHGEVVKGCATPIINRDLFEKAVIRRAANRRAPASYRKAGVHYFLLGKLFCGECGTNMCGDAGTSKTGKCFYYYSCSKKKHKTNSCKSKAVRKENIEYIICKIISDFILSNRGKALDCLADYVSLEYDEREEFAEIYEMEKQLHQIERDVEKLIDSLITMPESAQARIGKRIDALETQRNDLDIRIAKKRLECGKPFSKEDFKKFLQISFMDLDVEANRRFIIEKFLNAAYLYNDGRLVVYLNYFDGIPRYFGNDDNLPPGKDGYKEGKTLLKGKIPDGLQNLPDFEKSSTLVSYAPRSWKS